MPVDLGALLIFLADDDVIDERLHRICVRALPPYSHCNAQCMHVSRRRRRCDVIVILTLCSSKNGSVTFSPREI